MGSEMCIRDSQRTGAGVDFQCGQFVLGNVLQSALTGLPGRSPDTFPRFGSNAWSEGVGASTEAVVASRAPWGGGRPALVGTSGDVIFVCSPPPPAPPSTPTPAVPPGEMASDTRPVPTPGSDGFEAWKLLLIDTTVNVTDRLFSTVAANLTACAEECLDVAECAVFSFIATGPGLCIGGSSDAATAVHASYNLYQLMPPTPPPAMLGDARHRSGGFE